MSGDSQKDTGRANGNAGILNTLVLVHLNVARQNNTEKYVLWCRSKCVAEAAERNLKCTNATGAAECGARCTIFSGCLNLKRDIQTRAKG
ncbi:hypothetical protein EVAR_17748_1 [Eumeta japonica]|uniref:Uncharacterized protein n=1 Tax=Eumeta variegata TaxID=151549 RepID=A0A4C1TTM9_EUMVA|nr:hypothetical protein EVAR_17748_1 [Eumeta japonica]